MGVDEYILGLAPEHKILVKYFHDLLELEYGLRAKIRYGIPFYDGKSWICYLNPLQEPAIEVAFTRGNELINHHDILDFKGRKQVAGLEINKLDLSVIEIVEMLIQDAIALDLEKPYLSKRKKKK